MSNVWTSPLGKTVYERTYSRRKPDGRQEEWHDTVARVVHGNCSFVADAIDVGLVDRYLLA